MIRIQSVKNQKQIADTCVVANSFLSRFKGLMGKTGLSEGQGLLLDPCNDIHMWFMKIPLDVVFLIPVRSTGSSSLLKVTSVREHLKPWRLLPVGDAKASLTLELPVGTIRRCEIEVGDELCIS